jgi:hypothetical protein
VRYFGAYQIPTTRIATRTNPMTNFFICCQLNLKTVFSPQIKADEIFLPPASLDKNGQLRTRAHVFAGSDLLPARPQSLMRQRVKVILPVRADYLIGGRCRRLSKA